MCSHLGRPKTERGPREYSIEPVRGTLRELLPDDRIRVLENTRFDSGRDDERRGLRAGARGGLRPLRERRLRRRRTARTRRRRAVAQLLPAYAGLLLERELEHLGALLGEVERPFVIVAGGAKVDDKLGVLENLGRRRGPRAHRRQDGRGAARARTRSRSRCVLPADVVAAAAFDEDAETRVVAYDDVPDGWLGLDIGPRRARRSPRAIARREDGLLERPDGRLRVAALRRGHVRGRARRSPTATGSRSSAAATRCARSTSRASPTASRGSRPAAARRSSCSRARSFRASPRSRLSESSDVGALAPWSAC